jgi:thioredoxin reductase
VDALSNDAICSGVSVRSSALRGPTSGFSPGGQASSSSRIENYLEFPMGSGQELAERAQMQVQKFGAIKEGEKIKVSTETRELAGRA